MPKKIISMFLVVFFSFSSRPLFADRASLADKLAENNGFTKSLIKTDTFLLTTYARFKKFDNILKVYIEGDGRAWIRKKRLSFNPTPRKPFVLKLAAIDPSENILYIARPCQYTPKDMEPLYDPAYWSNKRFSEKVISSINQVIDKVKKERNFQNIELVGFSGGGAVAAIITSRRNDVKSLRTIAGNLDTAAVNKCHRVKPLTGSLNPIAIASEISRVPQIHFIGEKDKVVPAFVANSFVAAMPEDHSAKVVTVKGCSHHKGWDKYWKDLLRYPCDKSGIIKSFER